MKYVAHVAEYNTLGRVAVEAALALASRECQSCVGRDCAQKV